MNLSQDITALKTMLAQAEKEVKALESGKKASSARARKALQGIKSSSHKLRKDIIEHTKTLPVKKKTTNAKQIVEATQVEPEMLPKPTKKTATKRLRTIQTTKQELDAVTHTS